MIRRVLQPFGLRLRGTFPRARSRARIWGARFGRRQLRVAAERFAFLRPARAAAHTIVRRSTTTVEPRMQLVLAPRVDVKVHPEGASQPDRSAPAGVELRVRESLVLRERLDRTVVRALRLERRVEAAGGTLPTPAALARVPAHAQAPSLEPSAPPPIVFRTAQDAPPSPLQTAEPAAAAAEPAPQQVSPLNVGIVADEVLRVLDRRIAAERERRGRV